MAALQWNKGAALSKQHCRSRGLPLSNPIAHGRVFFCPRQRAQSSGTCASPNSTSAVAAISNHAMLRTTNMRIVGLLPLV